MHHIWVLILELFKYVANANATPPGKDDEHEKTLDEEKLKDFVGDFNKFFEDLAKSYKKMPRKEKNVESIFGESTPKYSKILQKMKLK